MEGKKRTAVRRLSNILSRDHESSESKFNEIKSAERRPRYDEGFRKTLGDLVR